MTSHPFFSVIVPVYNRADLCMPSLRSVAEQEFTNFECIVVDDGSSDGDKLASNITALADSRFIYVRRTNGGGGAARNTGIERASGKYIAFLDSDDEFLPHKLAVTKSFIINNPSYVYYSYAFVRREEGGRTWTRPNRPIRSDETVAEYLFCKNEFIMTISLVLPANLAKTVKFDASLPRFQDVDFCLRLEWAGAKFKMIEQPLVMWNDFDVPGRTSKKNSNVHATWLAMHGSKLSPKERNGYKAVFIAKELGSTAPLRTLGALCRGLFFGGVPIMVIARQFLRSFIPERFYRNLVDMYINRMGTQ